jgi:catechol-2,3-dioxygenase
MFKENHAFSGFAVNDLEVAQKFYGETLGLKCENGPQGLQLAIGSDASVFVYSKPDHVPATYTILNFPVENIDETVAELSTLGVLFEQYNGMTDEKGIARGLARHMGPDIAWFKDPAGNILSILQDH